MQETGDDLRLLIRKMLNELDAYPDVGSGSCGEDDVRLHTGHPLCDIGRRVVRAIRDSKLDKSGAPNFPGEGGKLWYRLLNTSRKPEIDMAVLDETRVKISRWLRHHYHAELVDQTGHANESMLPTNRSQPDKHVVGPSHDIQLQRTILVSGSGKHIQSEHGRKLFRDFCRALGSRLANTELTIVVGSTHEPTADRQFLEGANQVGSVTNLRVITRTEEVHDGPTFAELQRDLPNLNLCKMQIWNEEWPTVRHRQVKPADIVLLVGGAVGTLHIAEAAREQRKLVIPVGAAGGSAEKAFDWFSPDLKSQGVTDDELDVLRKAYDPELVVALIERLLATSVCQRPHVEPKINDARFDVFLSHNSKDKPSVRQLGIELRKRRLNPWLDEWELRPGLGWQDALEDIIKFCHSAAICVADNGIGPWEDPEMKALLRRFVNEKKAGNILPVIPVLLPGAPAEIKLPLFLEEFTWVDLRSGLTKKGLDRLIWGITDINPNR